MWDWGFDEVIDGEGVGCFDGRYDVVIGVGNFFIGCVFKLYFKFVCVVVVMDDVGVVIDEVWCYLVIFKIEVFSILCGRGW